MRKRIFTAILLGCIPFCLLNAQSQQEGTLSLSIEQAQKYAIEHNYLMKNASLEIKKAEATKWYAISTMLPQATGALDYTSMLGYEMTMEMPIGANPITGEVITNTIKIPTKPTSNFTVQAAIAVSGAQIISSTLGKIAVEMQKTNHQKTEQDIRTQVYRVYFAILAMENTLELMHQNMKNMLILEKSAQKAVDVGVSEQTDVDLISVQVSSLQNGISAIQRHLEVLYNSLRLLLGVSMNTQISLSETIKEILDVEYTYKLLQEGFSFSNNLDYQLVEKSTLLAKKQVRLNEWSYGPTFSAFYQYTAKIQKTNFDMSPPNVAGFSLNFPIFSSGGRFVKVKEAKYNFQVALNSLKMLKDHLEVQNKQLRYNLLSGLEDYETQEKTIEVSQRVFNSISNKFQHGIASSLDVTQSSMSLINAQSNYIQAMLNLVNAQIELEKLLNK